MAPLENRRNVNGDSDETHRTPRGSLENSVVLSDDYCFLSFVCCSVLAFHLCAVGESLTPDRMAFLQVSLPFSQTKDDVCTYNVISKRVSY
jgi:hypothetical protein